MGKTPFHAAQDAARELVGQYLDDHHLRGLRGRSHSSGLTGALFREFAFTLAAPVTVPASSHYAFSHDGDRSCCGPAIPSADSRAMVNRHFEWVRKTYTRLLTGTLNYRPVVLTVWVNRSPARGSLLHVLARELAPRRSGSRLRRDSRLPPTPPSIKPPLPPKRSMTFTTRSPKATVFFRSRVLAAGSEAWS